MLVYFCSQHRSKWPVIFACIYFWSRQQPIRSVLSYHSYNIMLYANTIYCINSATNIYWDTIYFKYSSASKKHISLLRNNVIVSESQKNFI